MTDDYIGAVSDVNIQKKKYLQICFSICSTQAEYLFWKTFT